MISSTGHSSPKDNHHELIAHLHDTVLKDGLCAYAHELFTSIIWNYFHEHGRSFAWRATTDPYRIVISEVMLQQTQTHRVIEKYDRWCSAFPDFESLASATFHEVLTYWQGLGYNRRALYMHQLAQHVVTQYDGKLPNNPELLVTFPGIGPNTARSICAFAFNRPVTFIETNIRTVFIHCFFPNEENVSDAQLLPLIEHTVDHDNPRHWYYALMDFGVMLKKLYPNPSRRSKHHTAQSKFEGSDRQIRGMILRLLLKEPMIDRNQVSKQLKKGEKRVAKIIDQLIGDGLAVEVDGMIKLR